MLYYWRQLNNSQALARSGVRRLHQQVAEDANFFNFYAKFTVFSSKLW
jgi:hypothetical protein